MADLLPLRDTDEADTLTGSSEVSASSSTPCDLPTAADSLAFFAAEAGIVVSLLTSLPNDESASKSSPRGSFLVLKTSLATARGEAFFLAPLPILGKLGEAGADAGGFAAISAVISVVEHASPVCVLGTVAPRLESELRGRLTGGSREAAVASTAQDAAFSLRTSFPKEESASKSSARRRFFVLALSEAAATGSRGAEALFGSPSWKPALLAKSGAEEAEEAPRMPVLDGRGLDCVPASAIRCSNEEAS